MKWNNKNFSPYPEFSTIFKEAVDKTQYPIVPNKFQNCSCDCMFKQGTYRREAKCGKRFFKYEVLFDYDKYIDEEDFYS